MTLIELENLCERMSGEVNPMGLQLITECRRVIKHLVLADNVIQNSLTYNVPVNETEAYRTYMTEVIKNDNR